jgi:hypothetical protein
MSEILRCPYCLLEDKFRPLIVRENGIFICNNCGHSLSPSDEYYECRCYKCSEINGISA